MEQTPNQTSEPVIPVRDVNVSTAQPNQPAPVIEPPIKSNTQPSGLKQDIFPDRISHFLFLGMSVSWLVSIVVFCFISRCFTSPELRGVMDLIPLLFYLGFLFVMMARAVIGMIGSHRQVLYFKQLCVGLISLFGGIVAVFLVGFVITTNQISCRVSSAQVDTCPADKVMCNLKTGSSCLNPDDCLTLKQMEFNKVPSASQNPINATPSASPQSLGTVELFNFANGEANLLAREPQTPREYTDVVANFNDDIYKTYGDAVQKYTASTGKLTTVYQASSSGTITNLSVFNNQLLAVTEEEISLPYQDQIGYIKLMQNDTVVKTVGPFKVGTYQVTDYLDQWGDAAILAKRSGDGCGGGATIFSLTGTTETTLAEFGGGCNEEPRMVGYLPASQEVIAYSIVKDTAMNESGGDLVELYALNLKTGAKRILYDLHGLKEYSVFFLVSPDKTQVGMFGDAGSHLISLADGSLQTIQFPLQVKDWSFFQWHEDGVYALKQPANDILSIFNPSTQTTQQIKLPLDDPNSYYEVQPFKNGVVIVVTPKSHY